MFTLSILVEELSSVVKIEELDVILDSIFVF